MTIDILDSTTNTNVPKVEKPSKGFFDVLGDFFGSLKEKFATAVESVKSLFGLELNVLKTDVKKIDENTDISAVAYEKRNTPWNELILINKVPGDKEAFGKKVIEIAGRLGIDPNWIMAVIYKESGFDHTETNPDGGAYGLIQWYPSHHREIISRIYNMGPIEQLEEVYNYLLPYKSRIHSYPDTYLAVFQPAQLGKTGLMPQKIYKQNKIVDVNKDGIITVEEFKNKYAYTDIPAKDKAKLLGNTNLGSVGNVA